MIARDKFFKHIFFSLILLAILWVVGLFSYVDRMPRQVQSFTQKVDVAVVLTGGSKRIEHGFLRVATGLAERVFISGVNDESTPSSVINLVKLSVANISDNRIVLGYEARSTIGNAREVAQWVEAHDIRSIRLITANYHMPRSLMEFSRVLPDNVALVPDPVFPEGFDISRWVSDSNSRRLVISEYHKFIASHLQHWLYW